MVVESGKLVVVPAGRAKGLRRPIVSRKGALISIEAETLVRSKGPALRPWEATGSIDVELLVAWAFGVQKADRHAGVGLLPMEAAIDMGGEAHGRTSDGSAALAEMERMGCRIDRRVGTVRDLVHPAAEAVASIVDGLESAAMVRHYGRLGVRPSGWQEPRRWWRPVVWKVPGVEGQWERVGRGVNAGRVTRVIQTVTRDELVRRRAGYIAWWEALDRLAWLLSMRALGFTVQRPRAPREPWAGEGN